jgi:hypothetical protein
MRWPSINQIFSIYNKDILDDTDLYDIVIDCIDSVWNDEDVIKADDYPRASREKFVDSLTIDQMARLLNFIKACPTVKVKSDVRCPHCQNDNSVVVEGIENFFG